MKVVGQALNVSEGGGGWVGGIALITANNLFSKEICN